MALKPVALRGGLDLMTPATSVAPGTCQEVLNYERGIREGYSRIDGVRRVDGRTVNSGAAGGDGRVLFIYHWVGFSAPTIAPSVGDVLRLSDYLSIPAAPFDAPAVLLKAFSGSIVNEVIVFAIYLSQPLNDDYPVLFLYDSSTGELLADIQGGTLTLVTKPQAIATYGVTEDAIANAYETLVAVSPPVAPIFGDSYDGTAAEMDAEMATLYSSQRDNVDAIPGRQGSDIIGAFWLKNRLYAIRDLMRLDFVDGLYTDANEGQFVTINGLEYEILAVTQKGGGQGFLTLDPVAGSGADATGVSSPLAVAITGTPPDCDVTVNYNELAAGFTFGIDNETGAVTWSIVDDDFAASSLIDADNPSLVAQQTNAALWKADSSGWTRVDGGREMLFSDGSPNLTAFNREATLDGATVKDTGNVFPTASTLNGAANTGVNSDNGVTAALSGASGDIFVAAGFDFSAIPSSAIIRGVEVTIERQSDTANAARDNTVTLVNVGGAENKAQGVWPNTIAAATYGGANDLWGNQALSVTDLQAAAFGVMVVADRNSAGTAAVGGIDYIAVKVYYVERDTPAYVWNGTTDQAITIRHVQFRGGDTADSTAYGYMTLTAPQNADKTRIIDVGDEIRSAASGGGNLLGLVAARDVPIFFPGQDDLDNNNSQYEAEVSNFYASDQLDAAYIVAGVGPCICYDGARTIRIRADLPAQDDNPRHVARHGEKLALGYYGGALALSLPNNPFEFRGSEGATFLPFGDRITGLRGRSSDELLVPCESSLQYYSGYTNQTGLRQVITRTRGMLEYTDADMGIVLGCDGLGVFDIRTAFSFGPADRNYLSDKIAPWLQPRLQATDNAGQASIRPIAALARRAKNQYRLFFMDGYFVTGTVTELGVEWMIQRYTDPSQNDRPLAVRALCSGIDSAGRERVFASFRNAKEGYMFELDSGRSFDGDAIPAYLVLNPISHTAGAPSQLGQSDRLFMYGVGYGYANLTVSRAANYETPDPDLNLSMTLGATTATATTIAQPFRGAVDFPIEGYDVTWRFDSSTAIEGPHTLQFTNLYANDRGTSRGNTGN